MPQSPQAPDPLAFTPANVAGMVALVSLVVLILCALGDEYAATTVMLFWTSLTLSAAAGLSCLILWSIGA